VSDEAALRLFGVILLLCAVALVAVASQTDGVQLIWEFLTATIRRIVTGD
jgi:Flp pilus assembly pilin Flp